MSQVKEVEQIEEGKEYTFYAWIENAPSSVTFRVSGGQRQKDTNGMILALDHHQEQFIMGIFKTRDPETIRQLRKFIANGDTITEDYEVYLSHIQKPEDQSKRKAAQAANLQKEVESKDAEINRLKAKLQEKGARGSNAGA